MPKVKKLKADEEAVDVRVTLANALSRAREVLRPPERLTVSEWADRYRTLSSEETARPGLWDTSEVPYMRFIMDSFSNEELREIVWLKCTQIGGTEAMLNMLGHTVDINPHRVYYVLPDDDLCDKFSVNRVQRMFKSNPERFEGKAPRKTDPKFINFRGGFIAIASARSPSELASWSVPFVFLDEIDKFPVWSGREANPLKLAEERTKNWPVAKVVKVSTPTLKTGAIYTAYEAADVRYRYYVPCPHCGRMQPFVFANLKWPKDESGNADPTLVSYQAYYECEACHGRIDDRHKIAMLKQGEWRPDCKTAGKPRSIGFHINSIYSPWVSFGTVAREFLVSRGNPEMLMNFVNSWLGEPWEDRAAVMDADVVLEKQTDVPEGVVPSWTKLLTGGVDVQKNGCYWTIRAWGAGQNSQNVAHGWATDLEAVAEVFNRFWPDEDGELRWQVNLGAIDSGYNTDLVYEFCLMNQEWAIPVKGQFSRKVSRYSRSSIEAPQANYHGQQLYIVNSDTYKDAIAGRLRRPMHQGAWMVYQGCDREYAEMVTAEHKVVTVKNNNRVESWVPKRSGADNHYLDTEVYAYFAADLMGARYLNDADEEQAHAPLAEGRNGSSFITKKKGWLP